MKKSIIAMAVTAMLLSGCMGAGTTGIFSGIDGVGALSNVIVSVLGINKVSEANLVGTWKYSNPGCAFTSDNLLAKAGGEVAASKVKSELQPHFQSIGISSSNTYFTFNQDKTFSGKLDGQSISGTYAYDANTGAITLKTLLLSLNGYITMNTRGISLLFESQKILSVLQTLGAMSGNASVSAISSISKNYDGVRIGFEMTR